MELKRTWVYVIRVFVIIIEPAGNRTFAGIHVQHTLQQILDLLLRVVNIAGDMRNGLVGQHIRCVSKIVLLCLVQSLGPIQEQQLKEYMHIG